MSLLTWHLPRVGEPQALTQYFSCTISVLIKVLNIPIYWTLWCHHIYKVHISFLMEDLIDEKTKGPLRALSVRLQKVWPSIEPAVDKMEDLFIFYYCKLHGCSSLHKITIETLEFGKRSFAIGIFAK